MQALRAYVGRIVTIIIIPKDDTPWSELGLPIQIMLILIVVAIVAMIGHMIWSTIKK